MSEWIAFGDASPLDHGGIWLRQDNDFATSFDIVVLTEFEEDGDSYYHLNSGLIDITDSWIDWNAVIEKPLVIGDVEENMRSAVEAVHYYGLIEFGGDYTSASIGVDTAIAELKAYGIEV